jgi:hypothetical protein
MGATSAQGIAVLAFLTSFVFLGGALFSGGSALLLLLFVVGLAGSAALFVRAKV